jgi:3-hydroxyanthranilate 3,4-dioxygenase
MEAVYHLESWYQANEHLFSPPVCNKLMHKKQLSVMFVGGPNTRTDFHIEEGSEFFWMVKGNMQLPTIQQGKLKVVHIREGEVFLLPSRVPHSPQRPETGRYDRRCFCCVCLFILFFKPPPDRSLGLVVERERYKESDPPELDCLRYYVDFATCETVLWERFFHCWDLGRDLVPVVQAYFASDEYKTRVPGAHVLPEAARPLQQDLTTAVPDPVNLEAWLAAHAAALDAGEALPLFGPAHPDREVAVTVYGGGPAGATRARAAWAGDSWVFVLRGMATVTPAATTPQQLYVHCGGVVPPQTPYSLELAPGALAWVVTMDPKGNKKQ